MTQRTYEIAAQLLEKDIAFSRNRHFDAYNDPLFKSALALARRLRGLATALRDAHQRGGSIVVEEDVAAGRSGVRIEIRAPRLLRTSWLEPAAFHVLLRVADVRPLIQGALTAHRDHG